MNTLITITQARAHVRVEDDYPAEQLRAYISAAESAIEAHLNRALYADAAALAAARAAYPAAVSAANQALESDLAVADAIPDAGERATAGIVARLTHADHIDIARRCLDGMVATPDIHAAILLMLGHLYANRSAVVAGNNAARLPMGVQYLLRPYRKGCSP